MKRLLALIIFFMFSIQFLKAADVVLESCTTQDNPLTFSFMWKIKVNKIIKKGKYLRLRFTYNLNGKENRVDLKLPPAHPIRKFDGIMFTISTSKELDTRLYLSAYWHKNCFMGGHRQIFTGKRYNAFRFKYLQEAKLDIGQEAVLIKSCKDTKKANFNRMMSFRNHRFFEPFTLKVKADIVDSRKMYFYSLERPNIKGLSHEEAVKILTIHRNKVEQDYQERFATLDDLFLAQTHLNSIKKAKTKPVQKQTTEENLNVKYASNRFCFDIVRNYLKMPTHKANFIVAPGLTYVNLSKFYLGSAGNTRKELAEICRYPDSNKKLLKGIKKLQNSIKKDSIPKKAQYETADSIWFDKSLGQFNNTYLQMISTYISPDFYKVNFNKKIEACEKINSWASEKTHDRIKKLLRPQQLDGSDVVSLSTAYFKGAWANQFKVKQTRKMDFNKYSSQKTKVMMMHQTKGFKYFENEKFKLLEIPFKGDAFSMNIILPSKILSPDKFTEFLSLGYLEMPLTRQKKVCRVDVQLPRFSFASKVPNKEILKSMGLKLPFSNVADFNKIFDSISDLFISDMFQKAWIKVDENGAEAAAVDVIIAIRSAMPSQEKPKKFHASRPFMFFITHNPSKTILFIGIVSDPDKFE